MGELVEIANLSPEMRAQLVADSLGKFSDGNPRQRVFDAALLQIRNAITLATRQAQQSLGRDGE